jgi:hypothetical protein
MYGLVVVNREDGDMVVWNFVNKRFCVLCKNDNMVNYSTYVKNKNMLVNGFINNVRLRILNILE